jgi:CDP-diacylglycerol---glycerol-3-phosphate 3-phosphatidyltransferase
MTSKTENAKLFNPANVVTLTRIGLLVVLALLLQIDSQWVKITALLLIPIIFYMDSLDGYLARHLDCATQLGSVLDVVGDRIVEMVLWMFLGFIGLVPLWIPVLVIVRGFITDGFRNIAIAKGHTTFSMMKTKIGWWCVASPLSRTSYAVAKAVVFCFGIAIWAFSLQSFPAVMFSFYLLVGLTLLHSLIRAVFSIIESVKLMS